MVETNAVPEKTIVLIRQVILQCDTDGSAGFDACEHEHQGMQRHDRRVPVCPTLSVELH
jgi:histone deacetylase HOS3